MRKIAALAVTLTAALLFAGAARAENRIFIIPNNPDGYGVDRCLASGESCGMTIATAYCHAQAFASAKSFRKLDRDEITGAVPTSGKNACVGSCDSFVAIVCAR